jgi:hypothetical protein
VEAFAMMRKMSLFLPAVLLTLAGCSSHYMVRDPASGSTYYTRDVDRTGDSGSVKFKDDSTGAKVIIQQSEVRKVSEDEYEAGVKRAK